MSEMVERVAAAIKSEFRPPDGIPSMTLSDDACTRFARAAVAALRDPTESMLRAGAKGCGEDREEVAGGAWEAMIDAALK